MICPYCKNLLQDAVGVVICPYCGGQICMQQAPQYQQAPQFQQPPQYQQAPPPYPGREYPRSNNRTEQVNMFTAWKKYAQFSGRARRSEYWLWVLFNCLVWLIGAVLFFLLLEGGGDEDVAVVLSIAACIYGVAMFIPNLAVSVRRLHDVGKSGVWVLLPIIPIAGWIFSIILLVFYCSDSEYGPNQYGPNPKGLGNHRY